MEVVITAERASGYYNDGYADDVSLILHAASRPARAAAKTYLWSGTAIAFGYSGSTLHSETISGNGSARTRPGSSTVESAPGDVRVVFFYRRPKGKKRVLSLRSTGAATLAARPGGGGTLSVGLRITRSDFSNCHKGISGKVTLVDGAGKTPDTMVLNICGTRTRYVDGGLHRMRVRVTIGERR